MDKVCMSTEGASFMQRGDGAMQRLKMMLAPSGAVTQQLAAVQGPPEPPVGNELEVELKTRGDAFRLKLEGYDYDDFSDSSFRAVAWWLASQPGWSVAAPLNLPPLAQQFEFLCTPHAMYSMPVLHPEAYEQHGEDVCWIWQHSLSFTIAGLLCCRPDNTGNQREQYSSLLHLQVGKAQEQLAQAKGQLSEFVQMEASLHGKLRTVGLREAQELLALGVPGFNYAFRIVHKLQLERGQGQQHHMQRFGTLKICPFGTGLPVSTNAAITQKWRAAEAAAKEAAAAAVRAAAPQPPNSSASKTPKPKKKRENGPPPAAPRAQGMKRRSAKPAEEEAGEEAHAEEEDDEEEEEEEAVNDEEEPKMLELPNPKEHKGVALHQKESEEGYQYVVFHQSWWRAEKKKAGCNFTGVDFTAPWLAAYEYALWVGAGLIPMQAWHAHASYELVLEEAETTKLIGAIQLKNAKAKALKARDQPKQDKPKRRKSA